MANGVWAVYGYAFDAAVLIAVYETEPEATRRTIGLGYGCVTFLPWGMNLDQAEQLRDAS